MRPSDYLVSTCLDDWHAATQHAFCRELADGSLPLEKMRQYLIQDYMFVDGFVRLLASAIAHAPSLKDSAPAAQFLALVTSEENTYFLRSFEALDISEDEWQTTPKPVTAQFQKLMHKAATSGKYEEMLAVLTVAEWSYLTWATQYFPPNPDLPFWFAGWIHLHAGQEFEQLVEYLKTQLDKVWLTLDEPSKINVVNCFGQAVALEATFFDQAYNKS